MPDLIIKPAAQSGNKVIIQDQAGGAVLTTADSGAAMASNVTGIPAAGVTGVLPVGVTGGSGLTALGTVTAGNLSNSAIVYPAGHIIGSNRGIYTFTGDCSVDTTSEAWGPVVSLTLKKANANIYAFYDVAEFYTRASDKTAVYNVAYKSSSFTAAQGNTSHGGALLNQVTGGSGGGGLAKNNHWRSWTGDRGSFSIHLFNQHSLGNSAGDTYYFAPETIADVSTFYVNYQGAQGSVTLNVMEIA